ncbi:MAG: NYN domain-containing protein [Cytophagales bacterium]|nr:NYN domain-containing protein [Cytophagales bacterium]
MSNSKRYAILVDGGFIIKKLEKQNKQFPTADQIEQYCLDLQSKPALAGFDLLRVYFYHAKPATDILQNPLSKQEINLALTPVHAKHESLIGKLELKPYFAVRLGETVTQAWKIGNSAMKTIMKNGRSIEANDLIPNVSQKGVDLRIGLDIARLALKEMVGSVVVISGDSDLIPAFKFARREGVKVLLDHMGHGIRRDLKVHADLIL